MINHARTLLINATTSSNDSSLPGYALTDPDYRARSVPPGVKRLHDLLFGARPDWLMRNYVAESCLQLIAASRLADMVTEYDPRISYPLGQTDWPRRLGIYIASTADVDLEGSDPGLVGDSSGCCVRRWSLSSPTTGTLVITPDTPPGAPLTLTAPYAMPLQLADGPRLRIREFPAGGRCYVTAYLRPGIPLATRLASLRAALEGNVVASLFPPDGSDRQQRLRDVWLAGETFDRDAAMLLGLVEYVDRLA